MLLQYPNHCKFFTKTVWLRNTLPKHGRKLTSCLFIKKVISNRKKSIDLSRYCLFLEKKILKIFNSLIKHLDDNNLLNSNPSGFRPGDSCVHQLLAITNDIYKAFDTNPSLEVRGVFWIYPKHLIEFGMKG